MAIALPSLSRQHDRVVPLVDLSDGIIRIHGDAPAGRVSRQAAKGELHPHGSELPGRRHWPEGLALHYLASRVLQDELTTLHGRCGAWKHFFADVVGVQGIQVNRVGVYPLWPRKALRVPLANLGQGNVTPAARTFYDHGIVRYGNKFYDPSYGIGPANYTTDPTGRLNYETDAVNHYNDNTLYHWYPEIGPPDGSPDPSEGWYANPAGQQLRGW